MRDFLSFEDKEDTSEKLAMVSGKPTRNYLFANEINLLVNKIRGLFQLIVINSSSIQSILNQNTVNDLGEIGTDIIDFVNTGELTLTQNIYLYYKISGVEYVQIFTGQTGVYGEGLLQLTENDLLLIYQSTDSINQDLVKQISGRLFQNSTNAPTKIEQYNSAGTYTLTRFSGGNYRITFANSYASNKINFQIGQSISGRVIPVIPDGMTNYVTILTAQLSSETLIDSVLNGVNFEIKIYP